MARRNPIPVDVPKRPPATLADFRRGPLAPFLAATPSVEIGPIAVVGQDAAPDSQAVVFAGRRLQDLADYRAALQAWFRMVRVGGHLVVVVPHAFLHDRAVALPSRWSRTARRLYTPASLLNEGEEALPPNSYRVRWLGDGDQDYDYTLPPDLPARGGRDVLLALEKIDPPAWGIVPPPAIAAAAPAPDFAFEPPTTRVERMRLPRRHRILILKLDHLGDFVMGRPALERMRSAFPDAEITLVVGSWNLELAQALGLFDRILPFDIFPRNSSEEEVDVHGKRALFDRLVHDEYDLAVDLRTDGDTRFLLRGLRAGVKAGLGSRAFFPYLDIFLPAEIGGSAHELAWSEVLSPGLFSAQDFCTRTPHQIALAGARARSDLGALTWGPYRRLPAGEYLFEPHLDIDPATPGLLGYDVALDTQWVVAGELTGPGAVRHARFTVPRDGASFEFRLWMRGEERVPDFRFYGGRLMKQGAPTLLHQSEHLLLLVELVALRMQRQGLAVEARP